MSPQRRHEAALGTDFLSSGSVWAFWDLGPFKKQLKVYNYRQFQRRDSFLRPFLGHSFSCHFLLWGSSLLTFGHTRSAQGPRRSQWALQGAPKGPLVPPRGPEGAPGYHWDPDPRAPGLLALSSLRLRRCAPAVWEKMDLPSLEVVKDKMAWATVRALT